MKSATQQECCQNDVRCCWHLHSHDDEVFAVTANRTERPMMLQRHFCCWIYRLTSSSISHWHKPNCWMMGVRLKFRLAVQILSRRLCHVYGWVDPSIVDYRSRVDRLLRPIRLLLKTTARLFFRWPHSVAYATNTDIHYISHRFQLIVLYWSNFRFRVMSISLTLCVPVGYAMLWKYHCIADSIWV